jgi:hypothetical protein
LSCPFASNDYEAHAREYHSEVLVKGIFFLLSNHKRTRHSLQVAVELERRQYLPKERKELRSRLEALRGGMEENTELAEVLILVMSDLVERAGIFQYI